MTDPTTRTERLLADALHHTERGCWPNVDGCSSPRHHADDARDILAHQPLRDALASPHGTIDARWAEVEALLPDGWEGPFLGPFDGDLNGFEAEAFAPDDRSTQGHGPTPQAALLALADALRKVDIR